MSATTSPRKFKLSSTSRLLKISDWLAAQGVKLTQMTAMEASVLAAADLGFSVTSLQLRRVIAAREARQPWKRTWRGPGLKNTSNGPTSLLRQLAKQMLVLAQAVNTLYEESGSTSTANEKIDTTLLISLALGRHIQVPHSQRIAATESDGPLITVAEKADAAPAQPQL